MFVQSKWLMRKIFFLAPESPSFSACSDFASCPRSHRKLLYFTFIYFIFIPFFLINIDYWNWSFGNHLELLFHLQGLREINKINEIVFIILLYTYMDISYYLLLDVNF